MEWDPHNSQLQHNYFAGTRVVQNRALPCLPQHNREMPHDMSTTLKRDFTVLGELQMGARVAIENRIRMGK